MRIKLDSSLYNKEEVESLISALQEKDIKLDFIEKEGGQKKGVETSIDTVWIITTLASIFLPIIVQELIALAKKNKKRTGTVSTVKVDLTKDGEQKTVSFELSHNIEAEICAKLSGADELNIYVNKKK